MSSPFLSIIEFIFKVNCDKLISNEKSQNDIFMKCCDWLQFFGGHHQLCGCLETYLAVRCCDLF